MVSHFWYLLISADGRLWFQFFNGSNDPGHNGAFGTTIPVNDGATHEVSFCRGRTGVLSTFTDGQPSGAGMLLGEFSALAPLRIASSPCPGFPDPSATVTDVCLGAP